MTETNQTEDKLPAAEAQQDVAKASDTKAEAAATATASDELSEDDLEAVAGGRIRATDKDGLVKGP
jgi:hypothetical protein